MNVSSPVIVMEVPPVLNHLEGQAFLQELLPLLESDRPRIVLDCSQLQHVDSAGIEILLQCIEEAMKRDGDVKLGAVSPASLAILELMRVDRVFEIFDSVEDATLSFQTVAASEDSQALLFPWYAEQYRQAKAS